MFWSSYGNIFVNLGLGHIGRYDAPTLRKVGRGLNGSHSEDVNDRDKLC